jgi:hypothetical protein
MTIKTYTCPKCGKETEYKPRKYTDGGQLFIHDRGFVEKPFLHVIINEACEIAPPNMEVTDDEGLRAETRDTTIDSLPDYAHAGGGVAS